MKRGERPVAASTALARALRRGRGPPTASTCVHQRGASQWCGWPGLARRGSRSDKVLQAQGGCDATGGGGTPVRC